MEAGGSDAGGSTSPGSGRARLEHPGQVARAPRGLSFRGKTGAGPDAERSRRSHESLTFLETALAEYRNIQRAGGWARIPEGKALEPGDRSERIRDLRRRLAVTGDLRVNVETDRFDSDVEAAVRRVQMRHGLTPDGRVGRKTLAALNVPVEERVETLALNLERRRWLPPKLGEDFIWVNVPEFRLRAFRGGRLALDMPVVVGASSSPTPSFQDEIERVVLIPYWDVPESTPSAKSRPRPRPTLATSSARASRSSTPLESWFRLRGFAYRTSRKGAIESGASRVPRTISVASNSCCRTHSRFPFMTRRRALYSSARPEPSAKAAFALAVRWSWPNISPPIASGSKSFRGRWSQGENVCCASRSPCLSTSSTSPRGVPTMDWFTSATTSTAVTNSLDPSWGKGGMSLRRGPGDPHRLAESRLTPSGAPHGVGAGADELGLDTRGVDAVAKPLRGRSAARSRSRPPGAEAPGDRRSALA